LKILGSFLNNAVVTLGLFMFKVSLLHPELSGEEHFHNTQQEREQRVIASANYSRRKTQ
jgi:hypothetical protein